MRASRAATSSTRSSVRNSSSSQKSPRVTRSDSGTSTPGSVMPPSSTSLGAGPPRTVRWSRSGCGGRRRWPGSAGLRGSVAGGSGGSDRDGTGASPRLPKTDPQRRTNRPGGSRPRPHSSGVRPSLAKLLIHAFPLLDQEADDGHERLLGRHRSGLLAPATGVPKTPYVVGGVGKRLFPLVRLFRVPNLFPHVSAGQALPGVGKRLFFPGLGRGLEPSLAGHSTASHR